MFQGRRYQLIENIVGAQQANGEFYFQNQPQLQSISGQQKVFVRAIDVYDNNILTASPMTAGNTVATPADIKGTVLVISVNGTEQLRRIPLGVLNSNVADPGNYTPYAWNRITFKNLWAIDWTKTYVQTAVAASVVPLSFLFGIWYEYSTDLQLDNQP